MSISTDYTSLSGFRTAYSETELRLAIAIAEVFIANSLSGGGGAGTVTPILISATSSGIIAAGKKSVSVANIGAASGTLLGAAFPVGASISYSAEGGTLTEIAYNATGTTFLIGATE